MAKLTLYAMSEKGLVVLKTLVEHHPGLIARVITAKDPALQEDQFEAFKQYCESHRIECVERAAAGEVKTPYSLAVSWRWMIPASNSRLIVFHDSLLPRYRGFNPLVTALIQGDTEVGVTALFASEEYDRGEIIAQERIPIAYPITIREAIGQILACYSNLARSLGGKLLTDEMIEASPQLEKEASYSLWRDEEDYLIDWEQDAKTLARFVDAVGFPYQGASAFIAEKKFRVIAAKPLDDVLIANRTVGKVIFVQDGKPVVVCGKGLLRIEKLVEDGSLVDALPLPRFRTRFLGKNQ